jgi:ParB-like chromosome segregation protein Spo0J
VAYEDGADDEGLLYEIVDGYHRWKTSEDPEVYALTDGLVPVVELKQPDQALLRMATIRHNRARGTHHVLKMADIVAELAEMGITADEIGRRLQMDEEEVDRLLDRGVMTKRGSAASFGNGWTV